MAKRAPAKKTTDAPVLLDTPVATKPKPSTRTLGDVFGQPRAVRVLRESIASGRLHHAWIFHGPFGVGKMTTARALAHELLADRATNQEVAKALAEGTHPDLHVVTKELAVVSRIDAVRRAKQVSIAKDVAEEFLLEPALKSRVLHADSVAHKVFIVDEAELLNTITQNVLLKIIEEPPPGTVIILVTSDEQRLLTTIRSRCQRVAFEPLKDDAMQQWLAASKQPVGGVQRDWLISFSQGAPGRFLEGLENDLFAWHTTLDTGLTALLNHQPNAVGGLSSSMAKLIDERATKAVEAAPDSSKDAANRLWCKRMLNFIAERARRQLLAAARAKQTDRAEHLSNTLDHLAQAERYLDTNVNYAAVLDNAVAQIAAATDALACSA